MACCVDLDQTGLHQLVESIRELSLGFGNTCFTTGTCLAGYCKDRKLFRKLYQHVGSTTHLSAKNYTGMFFPHLGDILLIRYFFTSSQQTKFAAGKTSSLFSWYGFVFSLLFLSSVLNFKNEVNTAIEASPKHRVFQSYLVNFDHLCKTEVICVWCGTGLLGGCECIIIIKDVCHHRLIYPMTFFFRLWLIMFSTA